jgi:hypothetical protein
MYSYPVVTEKLVFNDEKGGASNEETFLGNFSRNSAAFDVVMQRGSSRLT